MQVGLDLDINSADLPRFIKQLGIDRICTTLSTTQGQTTDPSLTAGLVMAGFDGARVGIGGTPAGYRAFGKKKSLKSCCPKRKAQEFTWVHFTCIVFPMPSWVMCLGMAILKRFANRSALQEAWLYLCCCTISMVCAMWKAFTENRVVGATYRAFNNELVKDQSALPTFSHLNGNKIWQNL
jgi:hypothetical protein